LSLWLHIVFFVYFCIYNIFNLLYDNWNTFKTNYKNNPLAADRLRYDILFHSDLSRDRGMSNGIELERINWGNNDLIVIDESHNFRNGGNVDDEDDDQDIISDGEKKKVAEWEKEMDVFKKGEYYG